MIGILIALQINNWNEYQKERKTELKVMTELVENLQANIQRLQIMIERGNIDNQSADIIISVLDNRLPYTDSINNHFYFALNPVDEGSFLSFVGYEYLKNTGFEIIHDERLKKKIINLFEGSYKDLQAKYNRINAVSTPNLSKFREENFLFQVDTVHQTMGHWPLDLMALIKNGRLKSKLEETRGVRLWINSSLLQSLEDTQNVLKHLEGKLTKPD